MYKKDLVKYHKSYSFAALTCSISDSSPTPVKILYAFHEVPVMAIFRTARKQRIHSRNCIICSPNHHPKRRIWEGIYNFAKRKSF